MAYVAARGGEQAIQQAERLFQQLKGEIDAALVKSIEYTLPYLVDRVMGESSLYAPQLAALALAQTGGDLYEATLLLRAYRSTQPRLAYAAPIDAASTRTLRRISAAFQDIPGGQILGPTLDYSHRLLRTDLLDKQAGPPDAAPSPALVGAGKLDDGDPALPPHELPPVADWLRLNGLLLPLEVQETPDPAALPDVTREAPRYPAPRAHRLQALARADTGGILTLGYASMRGYGIAHPTVNEVRLGHAEVLLQHPLSGVQFSAGRMRVSQAEVVSSTAEGLDIGFAATLGWNEVKVIAAALLDIEMDKPKPHPAHAEEFVLYHTEPVEASGFCIHYKLPHYVTFNSDLDALRRAQALRGQNGASPPTEAAAAPEEKAL